MLPNDIDFNLSYNNFSPDEIQVDETINAVFVVDVSPSIYSYVQHLNQAMILNNERRDVDFAYTGYCLLKVFRFLKTN